MPKFPTCFCKYLLILIVSCWAFPSVTADQISNTNCKPNQSQPPITKPSSTNQLFKPGLYWNPQRQGWGINIAQVSQDDGAIQLVAIIYTYRKDGSPIWYLASAPIDGSSWDAPLQEFFWNGTSAIATDVGTIKLEFDTVDSATMRYTINGESGIEVIEFFEFDQSTTSTEITGLWFPPSEPGRGLSVSTRGTTSISVLYSYDDKGHPLWLIGSLAKAFELDTETLIPVDSITGYCLACTTINTNAIRTGALKLTYFSRSNAQLVTDNIPGWQADITITPLSDLLDTSKNETPDLEQDNNDHQCVYPNLITLQGLLLDQTGSALAGASVSIAGKTVTTKTDGSFELTQLIPENSILTAAASGHRTDHLPINLNRPGQVKTITLEPVILSAIDHNGVRMLFGGDVAFGRRYLDPSESTPSNQIPADHPDALIKASNPEPGTRAVLKELRPWYQEADFGVINFETPITDNPATPHQQKPFRFFTLPQSIASLEWLGIDYVSMGNNHVYDYLEQGLIDTVAHLDKTDIGYSGAGLNSKQAFAAYRTTLAGSPYAFLSMTSVSGSQYPLDFVADENKGGAADLRKSDKVVASILNEQDAGYIPIVQYHTGKEYIFEPTEYVLGRMKLAADNNVPLLVTHHPHVAQGVGIINNMVALLGLGNLAFDQARLETMLGLVARVDMNGKQVKQVRLLPVYLENYAPQLISGRLASNFLRRIGEFSHAYGGFVYPYNGQGWVDLGNSSSRRLEHAVNVDINIPASGTTIVDLRTWGQLDESLLKLNTTSSLSIQMGRDLFGFGDFEDWDTDEQQLEAARWDITGDSRQICSQAYRGTAALCSLRDSRNRDASITANRNRIRVMGDALDDPNKNLSLFGYFKGENAGSITIETRYYASVGELVFGEENIVTHPGGTFNWQAFSADLKMPADVPVEKGGVAAELNARGVRMFLKHTPPDSGFALAIFDEIAVISWENKITADLQIQIPHAKDFLRINGTPGNHKLSLTFGRHVPTVLP